MKVQTFEYMQSVYGGNRDLEPEDLEERKTLLNKYRYSVIVEGEFMEFDNLGRWIEENIPTDSIKNIFYGKTDYNYGFAEFFILEKTQQEKLKFAIPNIYTIYPYSSRPNKICKSDGSMNDIEYTPAIKDAIIYSAD